jgi:hypothetical protein
MWKAGRPEDSSSNWDCRDRSCRHGSGCRGSNSCGISGPHRPRPRPQIPIWFLPPAQRGIQAHNVSYPPHCYSCRVFHPTHESTIARLRTILIKSAATSPGRLSLLICWRGFAISSPTMATIAGTEPASRLLHRVTERPDRRCGFFSTAVRIAEATRAELIRPMSGQRPGPVEAWSG